MARTFEVEVRGMNKFLKRLRRVEKPSKRKSILKSALGAGLGPIKTAIRKAIRGHSLEGEGNLYKAVYSTVRVYPSGNVILLAGVKDKKLPSGANPGKYFHLVDLGTKPHGQGSSPIPERWEGGWIMRGPGPYLHPGAKPRPILAQAMNVSGEKISQRVFARFEKRLDKEFAS